MAQFQDIFYTWQPLDWVAFGVLFIAAFGLFNGLYQASRLIQKGNIPTVFWVLNGVLAGFTALLAVVSM